MLSNITDYQTPEQSLWQGRLDSLAGERFFQRVHCIDIRSYDLDRGPEPVILGFCSDEGIRRNLGRVGAKSGPNKLREHLAKLACHSVNDFLDGGNIFCEEGHLEEAQEQFAALIHYCHQKGRKTIAFGGGHEIAWGHFKGLASLYPKIGIINFDAHFDTRPLQNNQGTSGTPFRQIKEHCEQHTLSFDYCCLGIQSVANTKNLFDTAEKWDIPYLTAETIHQGNFSSQIAFINKFIEHHQYLYLTICLDVFAECFAPGVSAPQPTGLYPAQTIPLLKYIMQTGKVVSIDIAELSPPLDKEEKTSRLAAIILAELLNLN